jgi:DNA-binding transcriptional LysR family regulator
MNLNLKYYHVFVRVYENMSMSVAAEELYLTQPAVSRIIHELEEAYQTRFFLRHSGRLHRTESGRLFYFHARQLLAQEEQLDCAMRKQKLQMKVHIGATPTVGTYYLPDILSHYREENNELDVYLHTNSSDVLEDMLKNAQLDFAIVEGMSPSQEVEVHPLAEIKLAFVTGNPDDTPTPLPLLIRDAGVIPRQILERQLYEAGIPYVIKGEFSDIEAIKRFAAQGFGIGVVPSGTIKEDDALVFMGIDKIETKMHISLAYHRKKYIFPQLQKLISMVEGDIVNLLLHQATTD